MRKTITLGKIACPRCREDGQFKVYSRKYGLYSYVYHYDNDGLYNMKKTYLYNCYIGKVINNHVRCITSNEFINLNLFRNWLDYCEENGIGIYEKRIPHTFDDTIWTNCMKCNKLHIFKRDKIRRYDYKYECSECDEKNVIPQKDIEYRS